MLFFFVKMVSPHPQSQRQCQSSLPGETNLKKQYVLFVCDCLRLCLDFPVILEILLSILRSILACFGFNFWSFWMSKGRQQGINNRCKNWHRKKGPGGVSPLRPGKPSPGRASSLWQCTRASLGIAFASFLALLQIFVSFWIDRKWYTKQEIQGLPKPTPNLNYPTKWCPMCQFSLVGHVIWTSIFHRILWPRESS